MACVHISVSKGPPFHQDTSYTVLGPTLRASLYLCKKSNSKRSHSEVLEFRTSSYILGENTAQFIAACPTQELELHLGWIPLHPESPTFPFCESSDYVVLVQALINVHLFVSSFCLPLCVYFGQAAPVTQGTISPTKCRAGEGSAFCFALKLDEHPVHCDHIKMNMK